MRFTDYWGSVARVRAQVTCPEPDYLVPTSKTAHRNDIRALHGAALPPCGDASPARTVAPVHQGSCIVGFLGEEYGGIFWRCRGLQYHSHS
jgi:hypothetical protein